MADGSGVSSARYRAFISYSHRDAVFAARLHRRLEGYVLPKRLGAGRRLTPIFKDREELPAAHDLSAQVRAALAASECLIVVCSPDAAASPWVGREIALFRELHSERPILAALVRGEPAEAFPPALADGGVEPLAADFRRQRDGEQLALLKLVAGIAGLGVDQLIQRDAQRRLQSVMAITAVAVAGMLAMGTTLLFALQARAAAERETARAERLAEFMLTDLRTKLNEVGRIDIMEDVNRRIWEEYGDQSPDEREATPPSLTAVLFLAMGEDQTRRGQLDAAQDRFLTARTVTADLLAKAPADPKRILGHAQSEYWVGYVSYLMGDRVQTRQSWEAYRALSARLVQQDPKNRSYRRELGFADGNLCTLAVTLEKAAASSVESCRVALDQMTALLAEAPQDQDQQANVANRHGWMADALSLSGDLDGARDHRLIQQGMLEALLDGTFKNMNYRLRWVGNQRALATLDARQARFAPAVERLTRARAELTQMIAFEPGNTEFRDQMAMIDQTLANIGKILKEPKNADAL